MKTYLAAGVLGLSIAGQATAHDSDTQNLTQPTSDDIANAKAVTEDIMRILESGDTERAIRQIAAGSRLISASRSPCSRAATRSHRARSEALSGADLDFKLIKESAGITCTIPPSNAVVRKKA